MCGSSTFDVVLPLCEEQFRISNIECRMWKLCFTALKNSVLRQAQDGIPVEQLCCLVPEGACNVSFVPALEIILRHTLDDSTQQNQPNQVWYRHESVPDISEVPNDSQIVSLKNGAHEDKEAEDVPVGHNALDPPEVFGSLFSVVRPSDERCITEEKTAQAHNPTAKVASKPHRKSRFCQLGARESGGVRVEI